MFCKWCQTENRDTARFCKGCQSPVLDGLPLETMRSGDKLKTRYEIRRLLGKGAMGAVYGALDGNLANKRVAIKEYNPARNTNPVDQQTAAQMFQEEAQMLVRLDHANMPKISDYFKEGLNQYLVMDFIDGMTLEDYLQTHGRLPESQVILWGQQIADVLHYLHRQSPPIIFRDMKPGNLMVDRQGRIKLIDFGIARTFKPGKAQDTQKFGTVGFAPPEAYGKGQTDARSDVYSLAVTLYVMLSAFDPTNDPFNLPPLRSVVPNVSSQLEQTIEVGRQLPPERRWQTMDQMTHALTAAPVNPPSYPTPTSPQNVSPNVLVTQGTKTRGLTQRLAERAAGLSNGQLALLFGGIIVLVLAAVWLFAIPITQADLAFDINYPMLATVGVLAYAASRKIWAPLVTFTPLGILASWLTRVQLDRIGAGYLFVDFNIVILASVAVGLFMTGWAYLQPRIVGKERPEEYTDAEQRLDMVWAIVMGFIGAITFTAAIHLQSVWSYPSMYLFAALNGLVGWFVGDFLYRLTVEKRGGG